MDVELGERWCDLCRELGWASTAHEVGPALVARYAEAHRAYHGVAHLAAVLAVLDELAAPALPAPATRLAAWFHDAVYDPRATDNEERSRDLAVSTLAGLGAAPVLQRDVGALIMATKSHDIGSLTEDALLLDADLSVLGASPDAYEAYCAGVRREYAHLDDITFRRGRTAVLARFLARSLLFHTHDGRRRFEAQARRNLVSELARLRVGER